MARDPYGNEIEDPFDKAIAQGVMRSTWSSAALSVVFALSSGCCVPISSFAVPQLVPVLIVVATLLAFAACINVVIRVVTMQSEHRALVPNWHPWAALALGLTGGAIGALQGTGLIISLLLQALG